MKDKKNRLLNILIKIVPVCISLAAIVVALVMFKNVTFDDIINFTPDNLILSVIVLMGLYAVKSVSVVIPLTMFFVAAGVMYGLAGGIIVSILGLVVSFSVPYFIGKLSGSDLVQMLSEKYPKIRKINNISDDNNFFTSYITRAVVFVPGDVVSMLLGACKIRYIPYIIGSTLGVLPEMILQVTIGNYLGEDVTPKMIAVLVILIAATFFLSYFINHKQKKKH